MVLFENMDHIEKLMVNGELPKYSSIGGYPLFYVTRENEILCAKCATEYVNEDSENTLHGYDINYEDEDMYCDGGCKIESAYGEGE